MPGKYPWKLEMKCRTCGTLCFRRSGRWTHEDEPADGHAPVIKLFGGGYPEPPPAEPPPAAAPPDPAPADQDDAAPA
jgi:hypothetical protein